MGRTGVFQTGFGLFSLFLKIYWREGSEGASNRGSQKPLPAGVDMTFLNLRARMEGTERSGTQCPATA